MEIKTLTTKHGEINYLLDILNQHKNKLSFTNYETKLSETSYEKYLNGLKKNIHGQNVTKSWLKMMELLHDKDISKYIMNHDNFKVYFNISLPGCAIYALNHYMKMNKKTYKFCISTYMPSEIAFQKNPHDKYNILNTFSEQCVIGEISYNGKKYWNDGDCRKNGMPILLTNIIKNKLGKINICISDNILVNKGNDNMQEEYNCKYKYNEAKTCILCLEKGGIMILKIFTFFTPFMKSLLSALAESFEEWKIIKPNTSKPLNSELYFIGIGMVDNSKFNNEINVYPENKWYQANDETINNILDSYLMFYTKNQIENIEKFLISDIPIFTYPKIPKINSFDYIGIKKK